MPKHFELDVDQMLLVILCIADMMRGVADTMRGSANGMHESESVTDPQYGKK